jgi:pyruvate ferredoxin oxidoreductase alpha subunit
VVGEVADEFAEAFGRRYGLFDAYRLEDAELAVVAANSTAGTARTVVDQLRAEGVKAGLVRPRVFRPFPARELAEALRPLKAVAVMDRSVSFGAMDNAGPLFLELVAALSLHGVRLPVAGYVYGLGGREILPADIRSVYHDLQAVAASGRVEQPIQILGVRA